HFTFQENERVQSSAEFKEVASLLTEHPAVSQVTESRGSARISLRKATPADQLSKTAYSITVRPEGITLKAWGREQIISAVYTLIQLGYLQDDPGRLAAVDIIDEPRFSY